MGKKEDAMRLFKNGYNCSQAVTGAFAQDLGIDFDLLVKISSSFGGGMGRMREVCGAVSGMLMVIGLKYGYIDPCDINSKSKHYKRVQECAELFKKKNGSIICRDLLGLNLEKGAFDKHSPEIRTEKYYKKRPCAELVGDAAEIIEKYYIK